MARRKRKGAGEGLALDDAFAAVEAALRPGTRAEILDRLQRPGDPLEGLRRLRSAMRSHTFRTGSEPVSLAVVVAELDRRTRREGFRVLHAWDPGAHRFTEDVIPVLTLDYVARAGARPRPDRDTLAILLDCYLLYVLGLFAMRAWEAEDAGGVLDGVTRLLRELQGPGGSGFRFLDDAETLLLLATSQYQPDEWAYDRLLERVRTLDEGHRLRLARVGAANLGSHLRWGSRSMYRRDPERMRADNVVDYPWLLFCLATLADGYDRMRRDGVEGEERADVVEALLNGLTPDPWAFVGDPPACLSEHREEHARLREILARARDGLLSEMEVHRPSERAYSPLGLEFNFLHNTLVARLASSLLQGTGPNLSLNALFTRERPGAGSLADSPEVLARTLMDYSGADPSRLGARGARLIVYDPSAGGRGFEAAVEAIRGMR